MPSSPHSEGSGPADAIQRTRSPSDDSVPTFEPRNLMAWTAELLSMSLGLVEAYVPGSDGVNARTREQLILTVSDINQCRYSVWVHSAWADFLGRREPDETLAPLFDYAASCAEAGVPLDATVLEALYPQPVVRSVRATVARAQLASLVGNTVDDLWGRVVRRRPWSVRRATGDIATIAAAAPFVAPTVALAGVMKILAHLAPPVPEIELPESADANLVVHLLAEAAPTYLGHTFVRTTVVWSPVPLVIAFRIEGLSATIRLGGGRVAIDDGVSADALLVVDGGVEPLLRTVAASILKDLGGPIRRTR